MKYSEMMSLGEGEREDLLRSLSEDEVADLWDEKTYPFKELVDQGGRTYFDDVEELREYLRRHHVPMTKPWMADEAAGHEGAHGECARALGAVTVRYYVLDKMHETTLNSVFAETYNPNPLPNLAWAAISMYPYTASRSLTDMGNIRSYGYSSREQVVERIIRWNEQDNGLYIPEPEKTPRTYL